MKHSCCVWLSQSPAKSFHQSHLPALPCAAQPRECSHWLYLSMYQNKRLLASTSDKHQHPNIPFQCEFLKKRFSAQQEMILSMPSACSVSPLVTSLHCQPVSFATNGPVNFCEILTFLLIPCPPAPGQFGDFDGVTHCMTLAT